MKKIIITFLLTLLFITLQAQETPDQAMNRLLELFRQFHVTSIPEKIPIDDFNNKVINKIVKSKRKKIMLSVYSKDSTGKNYILNKELDDEEKKIIKNTLHVIEYRILSNKQKEENKKTSKEIEKIFNYRALISGSLQDHWNKLTEEQKNDFYTSFKGLIEVIAYPQGSYFYSNSENTFKKTVYEGDKAIIASENYNIDKDLEISISYVFKKYDNVWTLVDVEMNKHSLVDAYRLQINRVVAKKGISGLLADLKKMYNQMKAK
jgi:ABC-type transporter MlaC component